MNPPGPDARSPYALREVALVGAGQTALLLLMAPFYGPHRDELYFLSAGRRLAWGYPDQPAFTPLLARVSDTLAPGSLVALRVASLVAVVALVALSAQFARLLGGGRSAQALTAVSVAAGALTMTLGHRLSTATFDTVVWTAVIVIVVQSLVDDRPRLWLLAGVVAGIGLNNKHSVVFLLAGILAGVATDRTSRPVLRLPWPWLGGAVALALWVPNLVWQARHDWPVLALSADIADEYGGVAGRLGMVAQALVMFSPVISVVAVIGAVQLVRRPAWAAARPAATAFLAVLGLFLVTGGKGYYLAGLVPPLVAAGCTVLAARWTLTRTVVAGAVLAVSGAVAWPALVPVLPVRTYASSFYTTVDQDQLETIGWPEYVDTVSGVVESLPPAQRATVVVFTPEYGSAGALEWYDIGVPVSSGHNGWRDWGPPPETARPVVVLDRRPPQAFEGCRSAAILHNTAGADNEEEGVEVWVCDGPRGSWAEQWPRLVHYDA